MCIDFSIGEYLQTWPCPRYQNICVSAGLLSEDASSGKPSQQQGKPELSPPKEGPKEKAPATSDKVSTLFGQCFNKSLLIATCNNTTW